jgi:SAM-dependent methyltransferase
MQRMDIRRYNREAWDREVERGNEWTIPVASEVISAARQGRWEVRLTPVRPVPTSWFPPLDSSNVLCLACGGGQQGPVLAAAGARVTVLDNSPKQLDQDRLVARRESLELVTVEGDMADLSMFDEGSFDLIVHPASNLFVPDVRPVWREAYRVLRRGCALLSAFINPVVCLFDDEALEHGALEVRHSLPYSDLKSLREGELERLLKKGEPLVFGHTLDDQIGGQIDAGFLISGFYEDYWPGTLLAKYMPSCIAMRAIKG